MRTGFLSLPLELRLNIYNLTFGKSNAVFSAARKGDDNYSLFPVETVPLHETQRSSQLLRVCRTILLEAQPILYSTTRFHVIAQAFAGRLPCRVTNGHPTMSHVQHLIWQLDCDLLKHFYHDDLRLDPQALSQLKTLELRCRAETWRDSFMGEWCDREAFMKGRSQTIEFAKILRETMMNEGDEPVSLIEDRRQLDRGRMILRLERSQRHVLGDNVRKSTPSQLILLTEL